MIPTGVHCMLRAGPAFAIPLPADITQAVQSIEVIHNDSKRSGFQIVFVAERGGVLGAFDYPLLQTLFLKPFNRTVITVRIGLMVYNLMHGVITHIQLSIDDETGKSIIIVTGEDLTALMDKEEKILEHPAQNEMMIINKIAMQYNLIPTVIPPPILDTPNPLERVPVQHGTDLDYVKKLADRYGYVFYVDSTFADIAYWGPPRRVSVPQRALSVNFATASNVSSIHFAHDALKPITLVAGLLQDAVTNQPASVVASLSTRVPLSKTAPIPQGVRPRQVLLKEAQGLNYQQAFAKAQATLDRSRDNVVTAQGTLDYASYQDMLRARASVSVRGAGDSYNGLYYVKQVRHVLKPTEGTFQQHFTLTRDGTGSTTVVAIP